MQFDINAERAKAISWSMKERFAKAGYVVPNKAILEALAQSLGVSNYRTLVALSKQTHDAPAAASNASEELQRPAFGERRYLVAEYWGHIFAGNTEQMVRFVFDREAQDMAYLEFKDGTVATKAELNDVKDSLLNANPEALEDPAGWGLDEEAEVPDWAKPTA